MFGKPLYKRRVGNVSRLLPMGKACWNILSRYWILKLHTFPAGPCLDFSSAFRVAPASTVLSDAAVNDLCTSAGPVNPGLCFHWGKGLDRCCSGLIGPFYLPIFHMHTVFDNQTAKHLSFYTANEKQVECGVGLTVHMKCIPGSVWRESLSFPGTVSFPRLQFLFLLLAAPP